MAIIQRWIIASVVENIEKTKPLYVTGMSVNGSDTLGNSLEVSKTLNSYHPT